jgi:hypothetical protein
MATLWADNSKGVSPITLFQSDIDGTISGLINQNTVSPLFILTSNITNLIPLSISIQLLVVIDSNTIPTQLHITVVIDSTTHHCRYRIIPTAIAHITTKYPHTKYIAHQSGINAHITPHGSITILMIHTSIPTNNAHIKPNTLPSHLIPSIIARKCT